ncbi:MAG: TRAP transporter substrate-binding protein [Dehalococcoidia bacterium]|nr:TRAP transporter substrate-binding protein [Dehalococcoidia bacterium]MDW8120252.1 TRAP transporter substrate-binding protein [Chloroflexota bacterium]
MKATKLLFIPLVFLIVFVVIAGGCRRQPEPARQPAAPASVPGTPAPAAPPPPAPAAPAAPAAQPIEWVVQSTFPTGIWDYMWGENFVKRVNEAAKGRLVIKLLPAGAVVPAFDVLDAVHKGVLDGGISWSGYWVGKNTAFSLFASATGGPFGMNNWDFTAWLLAGGGIELYRELVAKLGYQVVWFPIWGEMPEPLGWYKKPIRSVADLRGVKMRAAGLASEVFKEFGASVVTLPAAEIVPALERGVIDGAEYSDPHSDYRLGFPNVVKYYHIPGIHQPTGVGEVIFNKAKWDQLPDDLKLIIEMAAHEALVLNWSKAWRMNYEALEDLRTKEGVTVVETPREILLEMLKAWDRVAAREAARNPDFAKIYESQRQFASWFVPYQRLINPPYDLAADYYWPRK